ISYLLSLISSENGILFIDEIENGIHYTNLDKLWEIILTISKEQNVQVFATTHSIECIQSYARVAKKLLEDKKIDKEDIAFIEMGINKYNKPRAIVMDSERFFRELEIGNEVRGW
ncbi:MAG: ATP-binding protein, partial [Epsilonproteobacteria bacterium]|nr:ATP-binding protein [Campylobacterota bacterium]